MNETNCPVERCINGLVPCSSEEAEFHQAGRGWVKTCPHCANQQTQSSRREDFHADSL